MEIGKAPLFDRLRGLLSPVSAAVPPTPGFRAAGVLVPLLLREGEIRVLLARRTECVPHHKGQVCFPGGSRDPADADLAETALREAEEEIGLRRENVDLLGAMEPVPTVTGFVIRPIVARIAPPETFRLNAFETAEVFEAPLSVFFDFSRYRSAPGTFMGREHRVYFLDYGSHTIWGATAEILHRLAELLGRAD